VAADNSAAPTTPANRTEAFADLKRATGHVRSDRVQNYCHSVLLAVNLAQIDLSGKRKSTPLRRGPTRGTRTRFARIPTSHEMMDVFALLANLGAACASFSAHRSAIATRDTRTRMIVLHHLDRRARGALLNAVAQPVP